MPGSCCPMVSFGLLLEPLLLLLLISPESVPSFLLLELLDPKFIMDTGL